MVHFYSAALAPLCSAVDSYDSALLGMLLVGSFALSLWVWVTEPALVWHASGLWLLALCGLAVMVATLLLYRGLACGPAACNGGRWR